jgi:hypothetical protein
VFVAVYLNAFGKLGTYADFAERVGTMSDAAMTGPADGATNHLVTLFRVGRSCLIIGVAVVGGWTELLFDCFGSNLVRSFLEQFSADIAGGAIFGMQL